MDTISDRLKIENAGVLHVHFMESAADNASYKVRAHKVTPVASGRRFQAVGAGPKGIQAAIAAALARDRQFQQRRRRRRRVIGGPGGLRKKSWPL